MTEMMERPETGQAPTDEDPTIDVPGPAEFEGLCRAVEEMDVPAGYRAEIVGEGVYVSPWSQGFYLTIMESLAEQLGPHAPEGHRISQAPCLYVFPNRSRAYGPDVHVADVAATRVRSFRLPGAALSLVAELTSESTAEIDRLDKVVVYGQSGVPVYILVDMLEDSVTVYSSPEEKNGYAAHTKIPFGDKVRVPAPFDCELDTSGWES